MGGVYGYCFEDLEFGLKIVAITLRIGGIHLMFCVVCIDGISWWEVCHNTKEKKKIPNKAKARRLGYENSLDNGNGGVVDRSMALIGDGSKDIFFQGEHLSDFESMNAAMDLEHMGICISRLSKSNPISFPLCSFRWFNL